MCIYARGIYDHNRFIRVRRRKRGGRYQRQMRYSPSANSPALGLCVCQGGRMVPVLQSVCKLQAACSESLSEALTGTSDSTQLHSKSSRPQSTHTLALAGGVADIEQKNNETKQSNKEKLNTPQGKETEQTKFLLILLETRSKCFPNDFWASYRKPCPGPD